MPSIERKEQRIKDDYLIILQALEKYNFNKARAAKSLRIDRKTLYNRVKAYRELTQQQVA